MKEFTPQEEKAKKDIITVSNLRGMKFGAFSFAVAGVAITYYSQPHKMGRLIGPSIRSGVPIMAGIFSYSIIAEMTMFDMKRNPEKYI
jgi:hypothetical protein